MRKSYFDEYDKIQFQKARDILNKVYEYHYGDSYMRGELNRLNTIITKIEQLEETKKRETNTVNTKAIKRRKENDRQV